MTVLPFKATAAGLVPCGTSTNPAPCTICHLVIGGKGVIDYGMRIMTYVAIAVIVAMAILYIVSTGNEGMMQTAKSGIIASLIGFSVMLGAWLIVNTTLRILAVDDTDTKNPLFGLRQEGGFTFSCDANSTVAGGALNVGPGAGLPSAGGPTCENPTAAKERLSGGGTVCNNSGRCPSCNTAPFENYIERYGNGAGISLGLIRGLIARESSCDPHQFKNERDGSQSCGLMQVNTNSSTYTCEQLQDPETGIREGVRILTAAFESARGLQSRYGNTVTTEELAAAIHNAGAGQSSASVDCSTAAGWPTIPKWGCPINPGIAEFNACDIKDYACNVGACR